jgi:hypothetical protein
MNLEVEDLEPNTSTSSDAMETEQLQGSGNILRSRTNLDSKESNMSTPPFICNWKGCFNKSFTRQSDLRLATPSKTNQKRSHNSLGSIGTDTLSHMLVKNRDATDWRSATKPVSTDTKQRSTADTMPKRISAQWSRVQGLGRAFQERETRICISVLATMPHSP